MCRQKQVNACGRECVGTLYKKKSSIYNRRDADSASSVRELKKAVSIHLPAAFALASAFAFPKPAAASGTPIAGHQGLQICRNVLPRAYHNRDQVARVLAVFRRVKEGDGVAGVVASSRAPNSVHVIFHCAVASREVIVHLLLKKKANK